MLSGWEKQQRGGRRLQPKTIKDRQAVVRRLVLFAEEYPWRWSTGQVDEFMAALIGEEAKAASRIRSYQLVALCMVPPSRSPSGPPARGHHAAG